MSFYSLYTKSIKSSLDALEVSKAGKNDLEKVNQDDWLDCVGELTEEVKKSGGRFFMVGNGASAAFASHMSLDWSKNGGVPCLSLLDLSHLTALGNDLGYEEVFSQPVGWHGREGDILITISSSGNSPSILRAIEVAKEKGMKVVTLSGLKPDNASRKMGDINLYVPSKTYGIVECAHQVLLHAWLDHSMQIEEWARDTVQNMRADELSL